MAFLEGAQRHERFGQVNRLLCNPVPGLPCVMPSLGMFAEGRATGEEGLRIAEAVRTPSLCLPLGRLVALVLLQGDLPRALPQLDGL